MLPKISRTTLAYTAGLLTATVGIIVLIGWKMDIAVLKTFAMGTVSMKANTAACFILAGLALVVMQRPNRFSNLIVSFLALVIMLVGILSLIHNFLGWNVGLTQLLYNEPQGAISTVIPGLMAPNTALNFLLIGLALFLLTLKRFWKNYLMQFSLVLPLTISAIGFIGYFAGLTELTGPASYTKMAANTALTFIFFCMGTLITVIHKQRSPISIEQKLFAGLTISAAIVIFITFLSVSGIHSMRQASKQVEHSQLVKNQVGQILNHILEVQSGDRGYVLTGDEKYLVAHNKAEQELPFLIQEIRNLTADNQLQRKKITVLEIFVKERLGFSTKKILSRKNDGEAKCRELFPVSYGKEIVDSIRGITETMQADEDRLLQIQNEKEEFQANQSQMIISLSLLVQAMLLAIIFLIVNRNIKIRRKTEETLSILNEELECRVKERTAEIVQSEKKYRDIIETSLIGVYSTTLDGKILYANDSVVNMMEAGSSDEFYSASILAVYKNPEDRTRLINQLQEKGTVTDFETELITRKGNQLTTLLSANLQNNIMTGMILDISERKKAENAVHESEQRFRNLFEASPDSIILVDPYDPLGNWPIIDCNETSCQMNGYTRAELIGLPIDILNSRSSTPEERNAYLKRVRNEGVLRMVGFHRHHDGHIFPVDISTSLVTMNGKELMLGIDRDITERKKAEDEIKKANRVFAVLSNINQTIVHVKDKQTLFDEACRIAVEDGKFRMAWIGMVDEQTSQFMPVAAAGYANEYIQTIDINLNDRILGDGPIGRCVKSGKHYLANDIANNAEMVPWRENTLKLGNKSSAAFPITVFGKTMGAYLIYSEEKFFFDEAEVKLLDELAMDISFALEVFENEAVRKQAEEQLKASEERFRSTLDSMIEGCQILKNDGTYLYINNAAEKQNHRPKEELLGKKYSEMWPGIEKTTIYACIKKCIEEQVAQDLQNEFEFPDGTKGWFRINIEPVPEGILILSEDITERKNADELLRESQELFRHTLELGVVGMATTHPETYYFLSVNKQLCNMVGYTEEELLQMTWAEITFPKEKVDEDAANVEKLLSGEHNGYVMEKQYRHKDGHMIDITLSVQGLRKNDGTIDYILILIDDITERKLAERKIRERTEDLRLINSLNVAINQGEKLEKIIETMSNELMCIFNCFGTITSFPDDGNTFLLPKNIHFPSPVLGQIEKLIGGRLQSLPLKIAITGSGLIAQVMQSGKPKAFNSAAEIKAVMKEFTDRPMLKRLASAAFDMLPFRSMVLIPLVSNKKIIGMLEIARSEVTTDEQLNRIQLIAGQLTLAIGRKLAEDEIRNMNADLEQKVEQRTAELIEKEEKHRNLFETMSQGVVYMDSEGRIVAANTASERTLGLTMEQMQGVKSIDPSWRAIHEDGSDFPGDTHPTWVALKTGKKIENVVMGIFNPQLNDFRWININAVPQFRNGVKNPSNIYATFEDITERRQAEERIRLIVESAPNAIILVDSVGTIQLVNSQTENYFGYNRTELIGKKIELLVPHASDIGHIHLRSGFTAHPTSRKMGIGRDLFGLRKDGSLIPVEVGLNPISIDKKTMILVSVIDITERRQSEHALRASQERLSLATNAADIGIWDWDVVENNMVWDDMTFKLYGLNREEFNPNIDSWSQMLHPDDSKFIQEEIQAAFSGEREYAPEYRIIRPDGTVRVIKVDSKTVRAPDGKPLRVVGTNMDITERKQAEEEIKKAKAEAERANLAKSEFLSRMSHELRTPMNSILGFAQLMNMGELTPAHKKGVDHILKSGKHLLDLINEVLELARIESGKISVSLEPVKLSSIIAETMDIINPLATQRNIQLEIVNSESNDLFVNADRQKLKQVLLNLASNAVKYNREGGRVRVECSQQPAASTSTALSEHSQSPEASRQFIRIIITDSGKGISPEGLQKLFTPFERIGAEVSEVEGTGLGLTVSKKLIEAMHGTIGVESEPGVGSSFWIELPQTEGQIDRHERNGDFTKPETESVVSGTLLYIEDNVSNIQLVEQILEMHRPQILMIAEMYGKRTVQLATDYQPDFILLDLDLPDIHGSDVLRLLRNNTKTTSIPVVILSADAMSDKIDQLLKAGAKNYLTKPLDVVEFLKVVDEMMGK